ncbi:hypothetical protein HYX11_00080 [Candidatus Woesearchaeota archaeon]|nr:hypothetical protein [Candidatus Woesearchaeota archaeon]
MFLGLKLVVANSKFADLLNPEHILKTNEKLSLLIEGFEYDYQNYARKKEQAQQDLRSLITIIKRTENFSLSPELIGNSKKYEQIQLKQINDLIKIIRFLGQLLETEDIDLFYDVRTPLSIFEEFIHQLKDAVGNFAINKDKARIIRKIITDIDTQYLTLLEQVKTYLENEFRFLAQTGYNTNFALGENIAFELYLRNRVKLKRQINGKVQYIKKQLELLVKEIKPLKDKKEWSEEYTDNLIINTKYFYTQFSGLIDFSLQRIEISKQIIMEGINLQKKYLQQLEETQTNVKKFYQEIINTLTAVQEEKKTPGKIIPAKLAYWSAQSKKFAGVILKTETEIQQYLHQAQKQTQRSLHRESRNSKTVLRRFDKLRKSVGKTLAILTASSIFTLASPLPISDEVFARTSSLPTPTLKKEGITVKQTTPVPFVNIITEKLGNLNWELPSFTFPEYQKLLQEEKKNILPFEKDITEEGITLHFYPSKQLLLVQTKNTGETITSYHVRGGPKKRMPDKDNPGHFFGPTPSGKFKIFKKDIRPYVNRNSAWDDAKIAFGALIREVKGEIQVSENNGKTWFFVTGKNAKFGDLDKEDFYENGRLMDRWWDNPFGHLTIELRNKLGIKIAEKIHPNIALERGARGLDYGTEYMILTNISHGCMHIHPANIDELARIINMSPDKFTAIIIHPYTVTSLPLT